MAASLRSCLQRSVEASPRGVFTDTLNGSIFRVNTVSRLQNLQSPATFGLVLSSSTSFPSSARTTSTQRRGFSSLTPLTITTSITQTQLNSSRAQFTTSTKMASDEDYLAFLNKANEPLAAKPPQKTDATREEVFHATQEGVEVPECLVSACQQAEEKGLCYVSETDEPFELVGLALEGEEEVLPDEETFARLIGHPAPTEAEIQILDPVEWDSTGQYTEIVDAVREAGEGSDVRVYRVVKDHVRVYYWVVTVAKGKRLVGVKALSVES